MRHRPFPLRALLRAALIGLVLAGGCAPLPRPDPPAALPAAPAAVEPGPAAARFLAVAARMLPVATEACAAEPGPPRRCDFLVLVDDRPGQPANAFQTRDREGRPVIIFTLALIAQARNADELAFAFGHEAGHHIAGHLDRLAGPGRAAPDGPAARPAPGAVRRYAALFEIEADLIGTRLAHAAGFDPVRGAELFARLPDPGNRFLATHPPSAVRLTLIRAEAARLARAGGA